MNAYVVGLDVGGTSMKGGLVSATGQVLLIDRRPTPRAEGPLRVVEAIRTFIDDLAKAGGGTPAGVGLAVPGLVSSDMAVYSANIGWKDVPAADFTSLDVPVRLGHDVRTGGLAEGVLGAGRSMRDFLFLPIGTGIAGAVMFEGRPYGGSSGWGGEIGHVPVFPSGERCACGQIGCLETYASAASVARRYAERLSRAASLRPGTPPNGTETPPNPVTGTPAPFPAPETPAHTPHAVGTPAHTPHGAGTPAHTPHGAGTPAHTAQGAAAPPHTAHDTGTPLLTRADGPAHAPAAAEDVVALAMRGDPDASAIWDEALEALSLALASYTLTLDPTAIVIGGGLAEAGAALFDPLAERLQARLTFRAAPPLQRAALGVNAGMLGAALLGWQAAGVPDAGTTWTVDVPRSPSLP